MQLVDTPTLTGKTWEEAIETFGRRRRELVMVPISRLVMEAADCRLQLQDRTLPLTELAAKQLAVRLGITPGYMLKIDNEIAAENYNHFLPTAHGSTQVIVEDNERIVGFLGERSVPVPMATLVEQASERMGQRGYAIESWRYDRSGATFRLASEHLQIEPKKGDIVKVGLDLLNRENTEGGLSTRGVAYRLTCTNGATAPEPSDLLKQIRREGWRDPSARITLAFDAVEAAVEVIREMGAHLPDLARTPIAWTPEDYDRNLAVVRSGIRYIDAAPISSRSLGQTVVETMADEDHTVYGLYNALTRIGRDSLDTTRRALFEAAGFHLAYRPENPLRALHEAAEAFSTN